MDFKIDKKTLKRIIFGVVGCIVLYWVLSDFAKLRSVADLLFGILSPFVVGAVLAFIVNVPMRAFERWMKGIKNDKLRRGLALACGYVLIVLILAGVLLLLIPQLIATIQELIPKAEYFFMDLQARINAWLAENPDIMQWVNQHVDISKLNLSSIVQMGLSWVGTSLGAILTVTLGALKETAAFFIDAFVAVVFSAYVLLQKELLARQGRRLLYAFFPEKFADGTVRVLRLSNKAFSNFLSGQCVEVCILGSMFAVAMAIFGFPYIPLICVVIAVTAFVPIVGAWVGCIIGAFFIFVSDPYSLQWLWFCAMFLVVQEIENNLVYPRVVGTSIGLSGMWVLLAISVGGDLFGVFGMVVMIPAAAVIYTLLSEATQRRLDKRDVAATKLEAQPPETMSLKDRFKKHKKKVQKMDEAPDLDEPVNEEQK
jgi:predicted PurR-regulated permease PerM